MMFKSYVYNILSIFSILLSMQLIIGLYIIDVGVLAHYPVVMELSRFLLG